MTFTPKIVTATTDLVHHVRQRRAELGITQQEVDLQVQYEDGYTSKIEAPYRNYGRKPSRIIDSSISVRLSKVGAETLVHGSNIKSNNGLITLPAQCWLDVCQLKLVLMSANDAEKILQNDVIKNLPAPKAKQTIKVRRFSFEMETLNQNQVPMVEHNVDLVALQKVAKLTAEAYKTGKVNRISTAIKKAREHGIDPNALKVAVNLDAEKAIELSVHLRNILAYAHLLKKSDIKFNTIETHEYLVDDKSL